MDKLTLRQVKLQLIQRINSSSLKSLNLLVHNPDSNKTVQKHQSKKSTHLLEED
jgi:hypothetical protein